MIEYLGSLPTWVGGLLTMLLAMLSGLVVYFASHKFISKYEREDLRAPVESLFRVVAILVSLMLSLAFAEVIAGARSVEKAIEREAVAISDIFVALHYYESQASGDIRSTLVDYARSVSDDEWPALADDHLGQRTSTLMQRLTEALVELKPATRLEEEALSRILADVDSVSDSRLIRLDGALSKPPVYINVVFLGLLVTMACFGAHRPQPALVALVSLYTLFIGMVIYLIVALSDPFHGGMALEPITFQLLAETLASEPR